MNIMLSKIDRFCTLKELIDVLSKLQKEHPGPETVVIPFEDRLIVEDANVEHLNLPVSRYEITSDNYKFLGFENCLTVTELPEEEDLSVEINYR